ncbi:ribosome recycling factor [Patescibacteria group bacterium]|nr:ribosome recycling factor [Patescibacteria group bacterium]
MSIIDEKKFQFDQAVSHLKSELNNIRTGRANPVLVENLQVDYYGTRTPLIQLASISVPDAKSIVIQPWDKNTAKDIEKAIHNSQLGLNPVNEGNIIRLPIPPLTEERRKDLSKIVGQKAEEAKVSVRNTREEIWKIIKDQKNKSLITEDDMFTYQKELQEIVDDYNSQLQKLGQEKEKEILTI